MNKSDQLWLSVRDAATELGVSTKQVGWLARTGHLPTWELRGQQRWFLRSEVEALVAERARWVSYVEAARIIGCSATTVTKLVQEDLIEQRGAGTTAVASLGRESVERVAQERAQAAAELEARRKERGPNASPDDGQEWVSVPVAAGLLGITPNGARWMCENERLPAVRRGRRWWLRRDLLELVARARRARTKT